MNGSKFPQQQSSVGGYYPGSWPAVRLVKYHALAEGMSNTYFTGRLGTYKYYNMDQVVAQSLTLFDKLTHPRVKAELNGHAKQHT